MVPQPGQARRIAGDVAAPPWVLLIIPGTHPGLQWPAVLLPGLSMCLALGQERRTWLRGVADGAQPKPGVAPGPSLQELWSLLARQTSGQTEEPALTPVLYRARWAGIGPWRSADGMLWQAGTSA